MNEQVSNGLSTPHAVPDTTVVRFPIRVSENACSRISVAPGFDIVIV